MHKLYFTVFAVLFSVNIIICKGFYVDQSINVAETVKFYNSIPGLSWKAGSNGLGKSIKLSKIKRKLGWISNQKEISHGDGRPTNAPMPEEDNLPKNYDCRKAFPKCTTIPSIKDQSNCGSCWAVSVASTFSDRLCIHSNGKVNFNMSADQLLACDKKSDGCDGGYLDTAWQYIEKEGLVTGGDYGSKEGCRPYSIPPNQPFYAPAAKTPECGTNKCPDTFKTKNATISKAESKEYAIRKEIYKNGPIVTGFVVYLSFQFYESGIYKRPFFDILPLGGHAVRVIGWGEENGVKYWLVANSWGTDWGEKGTFRIIRGTNECGFESEGIAALPEN